MSVFGGGGGSASCSVPAALSESGLVDKPSHLAADLHVQEPAPVCSSHCITAGRALQVPDWSLLAVHRQLLFRPVAACRLPGGCGHQRRYASTFKAPQPLAQAFACLFHSKIAATSMSLLLTGLHTLCTSARHVHMLALRPWCVAEM